MIIPTKRFWWLLSAGILLAIGGAFVGGLEHFVLAFNIVLFGGLFATRLQVPKQKHLKVTRIIDPALSVNNTNDVELMIANESALPISGRFVDEAPFQFAKSIEEQSFTLRPGEQKIYKYQVVPEFRGTDYFEGTYFRLKAPLGLCEVQYAVNEPTEVLTYPNVKAVREFPLFNRKGSSPMEGVRRTRYKGTGSEFESLREYHDDDYRRIDWKSTARRGKLVVRDYEIERNQAVMILIDLGRLMLSEANGSTKLDHVLDTALIMMHAANRTGDQVGLFIFADRVINFIPPRKGRAHLALLLDAIHDLKAKPISTNFVPAMHYFATRWKRRALCVLFTEADNPEFAEQIVLGIKPIRMRHHWFIVRVSDPQLKEIDSSPIEFKNDLAYHGALAWNLGQREQASAILSQRGMTHIDANPEILADELVRAYWHAKQTAAI